MAETDDLLELIEHCRKDRAELDQWGDYYHGEFEPPYLPSTNRSALSREYGAMMKMSALNICGNTVGAVTDRLRVDGYRTSTGETDDVVWSWWQANSLDARQSQAYRDALIYADGYVSATPPTDANPGIPTLWVEPPKNLLVKTDDADPYTILRAAKVVGRRAWMYYPDRIVRLEHRSDAMPGDEWTVTSVTEHAAGVVPIVRFPNRLESDGESESEIAQIAPTQRRINQTNFDRMMVQKYGTWKQRWVAGIDVEKDEHGKAIPPFRVGIDQLAVSPNPDARFGEWSESSIKELLEAIDADIRHAASITQTPPHLLSPTSISNISAEALVALEAGLASKVATRQADWGEAWERLMVIGGRIVGVEVPNDAEVVWANLEARSQAQVVDGVVKLKSIGLPMRHLLERLGMTPQDIDRALTEMGAEAMSAAAVSAASFGITPPAADAPPVA
jgi:hypothetical protein